VSSNVPNHFRDVSHNTGNAASRADIATNVHPHSCRLHWAAENESISRNQVDVLCSAVEVHELLAQLDENGERHDIEERSRT
jgi:hypothetical protein